MTVAAAVARDLEDHAGDPIAFTTGDTPVVRSARQAGNLRQARVKPGMRVLEIGSGGPNAAMLAHLVGPDGEVVTVDIDESITARTTVGLERLGLTDRIEVITADAGRPLGRGVFDRIMVTVSGRAPSDRLRPREPRT